MKISAYATELDCFTDIDVSALNQWGIYGMAGMARAMGATLTGVKNYSAKIKICYL